MNSLKVFFMMTGLALLLGLIGLYFGGPRGVVIALAVAMVFNLISYWYSDKMVIRMYHAKEAKESDHPRLYKIVRNIALYADNAPIPRLYIIPTKAPNAFATGRNADNAAIAVTEGLLEMLNDQELEGVIGHEFAHIQNNDILIGTVAAMFVMAIGFAATIARYGAVFGGYSRENNRGGGLPLLIMALVSPIIAMILQAAISRQREFNADKTGAGYTQKYLPLASALQKLHTAPYRLNLDKQPATASMMIANPISGRGYSKLFSTHPPAEERIKRLQELAVQPNYQGIA